MKYTDEDIIKRLGLEDTDADTKTRGLASFYETLNLRIADAVQGRLTDEQLDQFNKLEDSKTDEWLHAAIPDYDQLEEAEADKLLGDIDAGASQFVS